MLIETEDIDVSERLSLCPSMSFFLWKKDAAAPAPVFTGRQHVRKARNETMMTKEQWLRYGTIDERDACGIGAVVDIHGKQTH